MAPAGNFDFAHGGELVTKTFDGLPVTGRHRQEGRRSIGSGSRPRRLKPAAKDEARKINKAADGWAFQIPAYKGSQFMTQPAKSLLKPRSQEEAGADARRGIGRR